MTIRVLLADDHKIVREGLMSLLEKEPDIDIVAMADNGRTAVQLAGELKPDVAVLDIAMPGTALRQPAEFPTMTRRSRSWPFPCTPPGGS